MERRNRSALRRSREDERAGRVGSRSLYRPPDVRSIPHPAVRQALALVLRHHPWPGLSLRWVAEKVDLSLWHLSRLIVRHTGRTFSEHVISLRLDRASELLADPSIEMNIARIAFESGFGSLRSFQVQFGKRFGVTPSEYRDRVRGFAGRSRRGGTVGPEHRDPGSVGPGR